MREEWFNKHIEYIQKINEISPLDDPGLIDRAEEYIQSKSEWVFKERDKESKWVDCFKKACNLETRLIEKDGECPKPPFMSTKLLKMIHEKGNIRCSLKYFEYLTLKCKVKERKIHTELGCQYIQNVLNLLKRYQKKDAKTDKSKKDKSEQKLELQYDLVEAKKDKSMVDLRNRLRLFLSNSLFYEPITIYEFMKPISQFLNKEHALMLMKLGYYKECFNICVDQIGDFHFSQSVAKKGFEWHKKDRLIYYNLFKKLMDSKDQEDKKLALQVLVQNCQHIPYEKITKHFKEDDELNSDASDLFLKIFENLELNHKKSLILKNLTTVEKHNLAFEKCNILKEFIIITEDPE